MISIDSVKPTFPRRNKEEVMRMIIAQDTAEAVCLIDAIFNPAFWPIVLPGFREARLEELMRDGVWVEN